MFLGLGIKANKKAFGRSDLECFLANACSNCAGPRQQFAKCRFNLMFAFLGRGTLGLALCSEQICLVFINENAFSFLLSDQLGLTRSILSLSGLEPPTTSSNCSEQRNLAENKTCPFMSNANLRMGYSICKYFLLYVLNIFEGITESIAMKGCVNQAFCILKTRLLCRRMMFACLCSRVCVSYSPQLHWYIMNSYVVVVFI